MTAQLRRVSLAQWMLLAAGNFVVLAAFFPSFGLPLEGLALLLGVDALVDPVRTSVNVAGHCIAPAIVARWEGEKFERRERAVDDRG